MDTTEELNQHAQKLISDETFKNMLEEEISRSLLLSQDQVSLTPTLLVIALSEDEQGEICYKLYQFILLIENFNDAKARAEAIEKIGQDCHTKGLKPCAVFMASEAWHKSITVEEAAQHGEQPVESYPDKQEIVIIAGLTIDGRSAVARFDVERNENDQMQLGSLFKSDSNYKVRHSLLSYFFQGYFTPARAEKTKKPKRGFGK